MAAGWSGRAEGVDVPVELGCGGRGGVSRPGGGHCARCRRLGCTRVGATFTRKADAERFLVTIGGAKLSGAYVDPALGRRTFEDYAACWMTNEG